MEPVHIPQWIDDPQQILLWRADDLLLVIGAMIVGVLIGHLGKCLLASLLLMRLYRRFRDTHPDGWVLHAGYWYLGLAPGWGRCFPNPFQRHWLP